MSLFDDVIEVSHGLVGMEYQSEPNFVQGRYPFLCGPNLPACPVVS